MKITESFCTKNGRYLAAQSLAPQGVVLHSIGTPQPRAEKLVEYWQNNPNAYATHYVLDDTVIYHTLTNTSTITIQRDTYPTLYYNTAAGKNKAAVICAAGAADSNGGVILRGWNADSSDYKELVLTYANSMAVPVSNGGTGATTTYKAVQKLFKSDNTGGITSYPTAPGIYRTTGTKVCTNSQSTLSGYGVLVIFQAVYAMHFYLDSNGTLIYGYSGDTFT